MKPTFLLTALFVFLANAVFGQDSLIIRDVSVLEGSSYDAVLNSRTRVRSTLPRSIAGRRPTSNKIEQPMPLGLVTFEGKPAEDFDVLLEYSGRVMTHFPASSARSKRLLWGRLKLNEETATNPSTLPPGHWLGGLNFDSRLWVSSPTSGSSKFLMYDIEHKEKPLATIDVDGETWSAKNTGRDPIHHVAIFRPAGEGRFSLGYVETVAGFRPSEKKKSSDPGGESNGELKEVNTPAPTNPEAVRAVGQLVNGLVNAVTGKPGQTNVNMPVPPPKSETASSPGELTPVAFSEPADGIDVVADYVANLADLGEAERQYVAAILTGRALNSSSATIVYVLDAKTLARVAPIEITPQPDRFTRTALMLVADADPSLRKEVEQLIAQLGDDSWQKREAAQTRLRELGGVTQKSLQAATTHSDYEIRDRAQRLLEELTTVKP